MEAELAKIGQDTAEEFVSMYEVLFGEVEKNAEQKGIELGLKQGLEKGIEKGIEKGLQQGKIQEAFLVFRNGLQEGLDINLLVKLIGIPPSLAERWKAQFDQNPELTWEDIDAQFWG